MATFVKFQPFVEALADKVHNLGSDTLTVALTNTAPNATDGGTTGPFRYEVIYNDTATNDELICYFDYGSGSGETLTIDFDASNGLLQLA